MNKAFGAIWGGIKDAYGELFPVVGMNVIWLILSTPILAIVFASILLTVGAAGGEEDVRQSLTTLFGIFLSVMLVLGPNPASVGIHYWASKIVKDERVEFSLFWEGLRAYWWEATKLFLVCWAGFFLLFVNALFYLRSDVTALQIFGIVWVYAIYFWTSMQIYQLPLLLEQEDKRLRLILRNSFFLSLTNFLPTLILVLVCTTIVVASLVLTLLIVLVTGSVIAIINTRATHALLERYRPAA